MSIFFDTPMETILLRRYVWFVIIFALLIGVNTFLLFRMLNSKENTTTINEELLDRYKQKEIRLLDSLVVLKADVQKLKCEREKYNKQIDNLEIVYVKEKERINKLTISEGANELKLLIQGQ